MKKASVFLLILCLCSHAAYAHVLEELWEKYAPKAVDAQTEPVAPTQVPPAGTPGRDFTVDKGAAPSQAFVEPWKYRSKTYELHHNDPQKVARSIYSLALHAGDISASLPREKFYSGVLGFHYSVTQICAWLNAVMAGQQGLSAEEGGFVGLLLQDGVVAVANGRWQQGSAITHVLAAAPGKKRTFAANLHHERLHVFWDEDEAFRTRETEAWNGLSQAERDEQREKLKQYNQKNEAQLVEEWAVVRAEKSNMPLE